MSDPSEQPEATQQGAGFARDDNESRAEATEAAERKAQELGVDLANVEGTGSGGRVTASDVEKASQQTDTTARSEEAIASQPRQVRRPQPCSPPVPPNCPTCSGPDDAGILEQYAVLKATLAGPDTRDIALTTPIAVKVDDQGRPVETAIIIDNSTGEVRDFPGNPCNFFAPSPLGRAPHPSPPGAPVFWFLPNPQPLGQPSCLTPCQGCICEDCFGSTGRCSAGQEDRGGIQNVSQHPLAPFYK